MRASADPAAYGPRQALLAQLCGLCAVLLFAMALEPVARASVIGVSQLVAMLQGGIATMIALRQGAPRWWLYIHLGFVPLLVLMQGLAQSLAITPGWFLAAFVLLLLVFWRTDTSRVPLYLSNRATVQALAEMIPPGHGQFIDLGCGDGSLLARLARARPDCRFTGIEHAPLIWLIAGLRTASLPNVRIRRGDLWATPLLGYDFVYAFLSPAPMLQLWEKARAEMAEGALLVSNSFAVPDIAPDTVIEVEDRRTTRLYCYRPCAAVMDKTADSGAFPAIPAPADRQ